MTERIILDLPDEITQRAREKALQTGRQLEELLTDWIRQGAADEAAKTHGFEYPIYTPFGNEEAAQILRKMSESTDIPLVIKKF